MRNGELLESSVEFIEKCNDACLYMLIWLGAVAKGVEISTLGQHSSPRLETREPPCQRRLSAENM